MTFQYFNWNIAFQLYAILTPYIFSNKIYLLDDVVVEKIRKKINFADLSKLGINFVDLSKYGSEACEFFGIRDF